jgi:uroporphyrinogen decarboxylase
VPLPSPRVRAGGPPLIIFARGAHYALEELAAPAPASLYDVVGLDWTMDPADVARRVGAR